MTGSEAYEQYRTYWKAANKEWLPDWKDITDRAKAAWDYIGSGAMQCDTADPAHQLIGSLRAEVVRLKSEMSRNYEASRNRESSVGKAITELTQQNSSLRAENRRIAIESQQRAENAVSQINESWMAERRNMEKMAVNMRAITKENESLKLKIEHLIPKRKAQSTCRAGRRVDHINFLSFDEIFKRVNCHVDEANMLFENEDEKFRIAMIMETSPDIERMLPRHYAAPRRSNPA